MLSLLLYVPDALNETHQVLNVRALMLFDALDHLALHPLAAIQAKWAGKQEVPGLSCGLQFYVSLPARFATLPALMNPVLKLLLEGGNLSTAQMAQVLNLSETEVNRHLDQLKQDHILLGWSPVLNLAEEDTAAVRAVIEVRITPERGGGFNRLAERISKFDEVESCYLMSGGYDLLVFVSGSSLQKVAAFVSEKLSTIEGVLSTATHFLLRSYKEHGFLLEARPAENHRLNVTP